MSGTLPIKKVTGLSESRSPQGSGRFDVLRQARDIVRKEADALTALSSGIPIQLYEAVQLITECEGAVIVTGVGKAGWIGQKISASFASTGTVSHFLNPTEAFHGDLGRIGRRDIVLAHPTAAKRENWLSCCHASTNSTCPSSPSLLQPVQHSPNTPTSSWTTGPFPKLATWDWPRPPARP